MKRMPALAVFGLAVVAAFPSLAMAQGGVSISLDWPSVSSTSFSLINSQSQGTKYYDSAVPFKINWNAQPSPYTITYRLWTDDLYLNQIGQVGGGQQGIGGVSIPARMAGNIVLNIEAYHPVIPFQVVASDSETETIVELSTRYKTLVDSCPMDADMVKDWAEEQGDAAVDAAFASLVTPQAIQGYALQYGLTEQEVQNRLDSVLPHVRSALRPVWNGSVDAVFNLDGPEHAFRMGNGNPFKGDISSSWGEVDTGFNGYFTGVLQPNQSVEDLVPQMVDLDVNAQAVNGLAVDAVSKILQTGQLPNIVSDSGDVVLINYVGIQVPMGYHSQALHVTGNFQAGLQNATLERVDGASAGGMISLEYLTPTRFVNFSASAQKTESQQATGQATLNAGVRF